MKRENGAGKSRRGSEKAGKIWIAAAVFLVLAAALAAGLNYSGQGKRTAAGDGSADTESGRAGQEREAGENPDYPVRGFSNLCAYDGKVYCGAHGFYGEEIPVESNIFTIWDGKIYYVEKVQEAFESLTDELMEIKRADMDGSGVEILADDVFLAGAGYEKLIGDKLFYGCGYNENHFMRYVWVDVATKEKGTVSSDRIESILGYDGTYLYYRGSDREKEQNVLGRVHLEEGRDETLTAFAEVDEEGYIEQAAFTDGRLYCLTLAHKPEGYDYRTFIYRMEIRNPGTGEVEESLSMDFTGSANYSFLVQDGEVYAAAAGEIIAVALADGKKRTVTAMEEGEYWGILYFLPGDGFLYYEAIAEVNEETGNNDYFYRVPTEGGKKELLSEWYTM